MRPTRANALSDRPTRQAPGAGRSGQRARRFVAVLCTAALLIVPSGSAQACRDTLAPVVEGLLDAVVNISTTQTLKGPEGIPLPRVPEGSPFEDFFKDFFNNRRGPQDQRRVNSLGSGFVIDASGLIVTNNHVIAGADEIVINFNDGTELKVVEVVGRDSKTDIALLRVEPAEGKSLPFVKLGDSSRLRVGDCVVAIGNPFNLGGTVTTGIISAKKRDINAGPYDEFLQTDAAINKGNSGGPLFNLDKEVIGVNTAIISPTGGSIGIGFATPSNTAFQVIEQLRKYGETRRGWLGVRVQSISDEIADSLGMTTTKGALVASVTDGGPAAAAGLEPGDVILRFNNQPVESMRALPRMVARTPIGAEIPVDILRNEQEQTLQVTIGRLAESQETDAGEADENEAGPDEGAVDEMSVLGMSLSEITEEARERYGIAEDVEGVLISDVDPAGPAAAKGVTVGEVIVEVTQQKVASSAEIVARIEELREAGRESVLLLISDTSGEIRFVAIPMQEQAQEQ